MAEAELNSLVADWAKPVYEHVEGSPYQPGDYVLVEQEIDAVGLPEDSETGEPVSYVGICGTVLYLEYSCGCGQTYPKDPMIGVDLENGVKREFWPEELTLKTDGAIPL